MCSYFEGLMVSAGGVDVSWHKMLDTLISLKSRANMLYAAVNTSNKCVHFIQSKVNKSRKVPSNIRDLQPLSRDVGSSREILPFIKDTQLSQEEHRHARTDDSPKARYGYYRRDFI